MLKSLLVTLFLFFGFHSTGLANCTLQLKLYGAIGPASLDFVERGLVSAENRGCTSILMEINTPGGNLQTTRLIVEKILNSKIPFLCVVSPSGGHAGSAGAIILQACHVNGAFAATNIGAATPIAGSGQEMADDLRKKMINDTQSWVEALAKRRGRDEQFARDIITEAKSVTAKKAEELGAIDKLVQSTEEFVEFSKDREVELAAGAKAKVIVGPLQIFDPGIRFEFLQMITDPQFAHLIFMGSLGLLYFEITHPGMIVPGVIGGIGLVISMVSFHKLNVDWGGVILILLGLVLMIAEAFVPSFGALGLGGVSSFIVGSLLLYDPERTGVSISLSTLLVPAAVLGLLTFIVARMAFNSYQARKNQPSDDYVGKTGEVVEIKENGNEGLVEVLGEIWKFESAVSVSLKQKVKVKSKDGLKLTVEVAK